MVGKSKVSSDPSASALFRWLPPVVVLSVVAGFVLLSWYAYHAGTQSLQDGHLLVVQADNAPVKEKPANAGGMQFPDQDKTIFDTFSAKSQPLPQVERVLPMPEEPAAPAVDTSGTVGWINDKFHNKAGEGNGAQAAEQVIPVSPPSAPKKQDVMAAVKKPMVAEPVPTQEFQAADVKLPRADDQTTLYVAKNNPVIPVLPPEIAPKKADKPLPAEKPVDKVNAATKEIDAIVGFHKKAAKTKGVFKVQLGAYRSEKEAMDAWKKAQKKHTALKGMLPSIIKADLGSKGVYYRLRVGGFASSAEAGALCRKLKADGQACLIPAAK